MEYHKDLLQSTQKPKWAMVIGVLSLLIALIWIPLQWMEKHSLSAFDGIYFLIFVFNGVTLIMTGKGYSLERLFGKAYLSIDVREIKLKTGIFNKERILQWEQLNALDYKPNSYEFLLKNGERVKLNLIKLRHEEIQELKQVIKTLATQKKIPFRGN